MARAAARLGAARRVGRPRPGARLRGGAAPPAGALDAPARRVPRGDGALSYRRISSVTAPRFDASQLIARAAATGVRAKSSYSSCTAGAEEFDTTTCTPRCLSARAVSRSRAWSAIPN
ncbi:MAG: hypothetical protein ACK559_23030, partial [bacterium]